MFAIGRLFFEMLVGELPNAVEIRRAKGRKELMQMVEDGKFDLDLNKIEPESIREIISRVTDLNPFARYKNVAELLAAVKRVLPPIVKPTMMVGLSTASVSFRMIHVQDNYFVFDAIEKEFDNKAIADFSKLLKTGWNDLFRGLSDDLSVIIKRAIDESCTMKNFYLGLEHIFLSMKSSGILSTQLKKLNSNIFELKEELKGYTTSNQVYQVRFLLSPRLNQLLTTLKKVFPEGVGERELVIRALMEDNVVTHSLKNIGVDIPRLLQEIENS